MLQAAIDIWREDVNAKGGLLGRPVEFISYDDQSTPRTCRASTPSSSPSKSRPAARALRHELRGAGDADHHAAQQDDVEPHGDRHQPALQLSDKYFSMVPVGSDGVNSFSIGFFEVASQQKPEAADGGDPGRRRRVRPQRLGRRPRGGQEARLPDRLRPELSAGHHRLHADGARGPGGQPGHLLCRPPIRRTMSASSAPQTRSTSSPKCSAAP